MGNLICYDDTNIHGQDINTPKQQQNPQNLKQQIQYQRVLSNNMYPHKWRLNIPTSSSVVFIQFKQFNQQEKLSNEAIRNYQSQYNQIANLLHFAGMHIYQQQKVKLLIDRLFLDIGNYKQIIISLKSYFKEISRNNLIKQIQKSQLLKKRHLLPQNADEVIKRAQFKQYSEGQLKPIAQKIQNNLKNYQQVINNNELLTTEQKKILKKKIQQIPQFEKNRRELFLKIQNKIQKSNLKNFFTKNIKYFRQIYKASNENFSTDSFHKKCDEIANTLTIVLTQTNQIVGGYTPLLFCGNKGYIQDKTNQTFLFSLTNNQKYQLINTNYAIYRDPNYGPSFGQNDLIISNEGNKGLGDFPKNFNNGKYQNSQQSYTHFSGAKAGNIFKIKQWQVYQVIFK